MIRVLHFADLHLGVENYGKLDPATGLSSRIGDFLNVFDTLVDYALREGVDLVLFAGDAFKTRTPSPTYQREFAKRIRRLAEGGLQVFLLVGNHDFPQVAGRAHTIEIYQTLDVPNVHVAQRPAVVPIQTRRGPVQVVALPWVVRSALLTKDAYKSLSLDELSDLMLRRLEEQLLTGDDSLVRQLDPAVPAILAAHGTVLGAKYGSERSVMLGNDLVLPTGLLQNRAFDYVALGHIHKHQAIAADPPVVYSGSPERIDFGEEKEAKGFVVVDLQKGKADWRFVELPARRFVTVEVAADLPDPTAEVLAAIARQDIAQAVVRLTVRLTPPAAAVLDEAAIRRALEPAFFVAAVAKEVERPSRLRLGDQETIAMLAPRQLLERYFQQRQIPEDRLSVLLRYADELFAERSDRRA